MALTTTQVNQAFLATLGRPAEGSAATWGSTSLSLDALLDSIFIAENTDGDFVEYLYQNILGRASDAEGKAFWNSLLATSTKEAVLAQFKAAVIAAGQADPANADYQSFIAQNKAFVTDLYTNLLGRSDAASADAEGVEFWANALASGTSKGALLAQFTAAALSDPNSDDAQTLNAKVNVANAITAKFNNFNADVTADQKKAALDALKATMTEVVAGSTAEDFQERIDTFAGNYQNRVAQVFTTKDDDQLDSSEATASTVFSGNVNLVDSTKGTIQTTDSVAGNSNYTDTLRVSVTSDSANKDFSLTSNLPTSVSSIEKLIVTAGAANVSGTLNGTNYAESTTITSTGDVDLKISGDQTELKVTAGDKKDAAITVESGSLTNYVGSAAKDTINVKAGSVKTIDTGAGKDVVTIAAAANIKNEGSIKLGAGDDELTIGATLTKADTLNKISLDGGEGSKDKLTISTDITAVNSITGFETITATASAKISADAANSLTSGTKLADGSDLKVDMSGKNSLNLKNLKVGNDADNKLGKAAVDVLNVAKGEVTLTSTTNNAIVETITLAQTQDGKTGTVTINGIGAAKLDASGGRVDGSSGDKLKIDGITLGSGNPIQVKNYNKLSGALDTNKVYYINTAISSADDLASKSTVLSFMDNNTTLASGKVLVALNNSAQNKSYVFEISGTGNKVTRDDITLKAIVDNAINSKDVISGGAIEFVAGTEDRDLTPSATVAYANLNKALEIGTTEVDGRVIDFDSKKSITVTGVNDELTVTANGSLTAEHKININASGDVSFAVTGVVGDSVNTLVLDNNKGITNAATLANIDVVKLNGTNNIADTKLAAFDSTTKIEATANDKVTTTTTGALDLSALDKQGTVTPVIDITVAADTHAVSGSANLTENLYLGDGTGTWASADLTKYDANVDAIYATATKLVFASATEATHTAKLDLSKAAATVEITAVNKAAASVADYFTGITADDTITFATATTANTSVTGSIGKDNITIGVKNTAPLTVKLGDDKVVDTLDIAAADIKAGSSGAVPTTLVTVENANSGDIIKVGAITAVNLHATAISGTGADAKGAINDALSQQNDKQGVFVVKATVNSAETTYLVYNKANDATLTQDDDYVVKLVGDVNGIASVNADGTITLA